MAQYIFETDGDYVNFNGGGGLWRLARASNCIAWRFDQTGDLFFDVYDQQYIVKAENIAEVVIDGVPLAAASDFPDAITAVFTGIGSGGSASTGVLLTEKVTLTDTEIKAAGDSEIIIVAAPGTNKVIVPIYANISWKTYVTDYGNINGTAEVYFYVVEITLGSALQASGANVAAIFDPGFATSADFFPKQVTPITGQDAAAAINQPLKLAFDNKGSGDLTGGNAANEIVVTVYYVVNDLS